MQLSCVHFVCLCFCLPLADTSVLVKANNVTRSIQ